METDANNNEHGPTPLEFEDFIIWSYYKVFGLSEFQLEIISDRDIKPAKPSIVKAIGISSKSSKSVHEASESSKFNEDVKKPCANVVKIYTYYDHSGNLLELKFIRNRRVPIEVLKIISLIVKFHPKLVSITINKGLDQYCLYELNKIIDESKITDVNLDDNEIPQANFYILLDRVSSLKYLSLSRCSLNDTAVIELALRLKIHKLSALDLSSNLITNEGAIFIGNILRSNRNLVYLNLSGNMIGDKGADSILTSLMEFPLNDDEIYERKARLITYEENLSFVSSGNSVAPEESQIGSKATNKLLKILKTSVDSGKSMYAFDSPHTCLRNGTVSCFGNNIVSYLNLAYNNLSYKSVRKVCDVLVYQVNTFMEPKGLIYVSIEGNLLPKTCKEIALIDNIIRSNIASVKGKVNSAKSLSKTRRAN